MNAKILLLLLILPFGYFSCSTDLDVTADPEDIPIIYGLISKNDSVHYIRIQRAYLIEGNAIDAAQVNDSIYYPDVLAVTFNRDDNNGPTFNLTRIDGANVNLPKDPGIFSNTPNWLYRFDGIINEEETYRLDISNETTGAKFTAQTTIVQPFNLVMSPNVPLTFLGDFPTKMKWRTAQNAQTYDMSIVIPYKEWDISDPGNVVNKSVEWTVFTNKTAESDKGGILRQETIEGERFYAFMRDAIDEDPDKFRKIDSTFGFKLKIHAGGTVFYNYVRVREAQTGLLSNEFLPNYTNVEGGLGMLSSRFTQSMEGFLLTRSSLDTLACGRISKNLNFMNSQGEFACK